MSPLLRDRLRLRLVVGGPFDGASDRRAGADGRPRTTRLATLAIWAAFVIFPVVNAVSSSDRGSRYWLELVGAVAFSAAYVWLVGIWAALRRTPLEYVLAAVLVVDAVALTLWVEPNWGFLFSYVGACVALVVPSPAGFGAVIASAAVALGATVGGGGNEGKAIGFAVSTLGVGLLLTLMRDMRVRNVELAEARAELARTAVIAERERFARDLHDLLGHSLSVIAIKAELAGRLLPDAPDRAAAEVADLETVARSALGEVREAVSGYRQPTLDGELEGARVALAAAGIVAEFQRAPIALAPEVEAVLAWAVREGATNVIRHSGARRCEVRVAAGDGGARVEVVDDGRPTDADADGGRAAGEPRENGEWGIGAGNGLAGLRERAAAVRGRLDAGALTGGGFRLSVTVPVGEARP